MASPILARLGALRSVLGYNRNPLADVEAINRLGASAFRKQNVITGQQRDATKFQYQQSKDAQAEQFKNRKLMFTQLTSFYNSTPEGDPKREYVTQLMQGLYYDMPREQQVALEATTLLRPISPEERREREFVKANPRSTWPADKDGQPLAWNEENADRIASFQIGDAEWTQQRKIVKYGVATGKAISKVPNLFAGPDVLDAKGEPIEGSGKVYFRNPETLQIMSTSPRILGVDIEKAKQWGWPLHKMTANNFAPTGPPQMGVYGGVKSQRTPGVALTTGEARWNEETYGRPDESIRNVPAPWKDALGFLAQKKDFNDESIKDGEVVKVMQLLQELKGKFTPAELKSNVAQIQEEISRIYPNIPYTFVYDPDGMKRGGIWSRNKYVVDGTDWLVAPKMELITITDAEGTQKQVFRDASTGKIYDKQKTEIPDIGPVEDGDVVPDITFVEAAELLGKGPGLKSLSQLKKQMLNNLKWLVEGQGVDKAAAYVEALSKEYRQ